MLPGPGASGAIRIAARQFAIALPGETQSEWFVLVAFFEGGCVRDDAPSLLSADEPCSPAKLKVKPFSIHWRPRVPAQPQRVRRAPTHLLASDERTGAAKAPYHLSTVR